MIASEYKNCFWNASGDLSCPSPGYVGPRASDYPNWKLYNNIVGVEPFNNKGYQTDYELAHIGTKTLDHYYKPTTQSGGANRYTQYKYPQPQVKRNWNEIQQQRWLANQQIHCEQQFGGNRDYDARIFARPNTHGFGGSGWGDAQIMQEGGNIPDNMSYGSYNSYNTNNINNANCYNDFSPISHIESNYKNKKPRMQQTKLTSYSYSISNPEMESAYQIPTYVSDYYKKCDQPNPAEMTARQQYDNMLLRYNDPAYSTQLGYPVMPETPLMGAPNSYENQFQITNNSSICYDIYNKKGEPIIQAPSYATILMNERPYLNPNPYGLYQLPQNSN